MRSVGFLCGAGTLLHEARELGIKVVGNVDTRAYFRTFPLIWKLNFPRVPFFTTEVFSDPSEIITEDWFNADLALGHPPCGSHSVLGQTRVARDRSMNERQAFHKRRAHNTGLLPMFTSFVRHYQPKVFALDNLPKILSTATPKNWWEDELPGYKLIYLVMSNWDYGSCQTRKRLWVIGSRGRHFHFVPLTKRPKGSPRNVWEAIQDLGWQPWIDNVSLGHIHLKPGERPLDSYWIRNGKDYSITKKTDAASLGFLNLPPGYNWPYISSRGLTNRKPGKHRMGFERASVFGAKDVYHPITGWPLTPRERARIMGWPDDFKLWDESRSDWNTTAYRKLIVLTGKAVPSHFPRYLLPQLIDHAARVK